MRRRTLIVLLAPAIAPALAWSQSSVRTRRSATDPGARSDLEAFGRAVSQMLGNTDARDPESWMYWANVHGVSSGTSIPQSLRSIWATCDHDEYFLAWHRIYLIYFEAVVAKLSGKNDFAMPYWDWFASLDIPTAFATPGNRSNPLWRDDRRYAKRYTVSPALLSEDHYADFNSQAFGDPHSPVHVNFLGEMSAPATAARDPIFWPHHVAMDRLWEVWRRMGPSHQNPSVNDPWASRSFLFRTGVGGERAVKSVLEISELGYSYDNLEVTATEAVAEVLPPKPVRLEIGRPVTQSTEAAGGMRVLAQKSRTSLTGDSLTVRLPMPADATSALESLGSPRGAHLRLRLSEVRLTSEGERKGVLYDVFVNLPVKAGELGAVRHRIGQFSSFGLRGHGSEHAGHAGSAGRTVEFSIERLVPALKAAGRWDPNMVEVDLVEPSVQPNAKPLVTIGRIELLTDRQ